MNINGRGKWREMTRYGAKGALTTTANIGLMTAFVELGGILPEVAALVSTCLLLVAGYTIMNRWVFPHAKTVRGAKSHLKRGAVYYSIILAGKGLNYVLFLGLLSLGVWYPAAWLLGSMTVFLGTFTANRWVWKGGLTSEA